ncbi:uncharacterized protein LOC115621553 [Scaptodrosophila lebanonensis]|uniref:Uncharacterized protein LOC115621553 n=1 Tax=Drosophila lebanonensis TaxID=7225 RepID=A0A6J2T808_DROLE|nr:uncharacterized protein LOC115621553 [Scaptodrosophila lebanonensis]
MSMPTTFPAINCAANVSSPDNLSYVNGNCPKGCVRTLRGRCVPERCTTDWIGWLNRPVTMSCYFHWFLLMLAALVMFLMLGLMVCNLVYEVRLCLRKRRRLRYRRFSGSSSTSSDNSVA